MTRLQEGVSIFKNRVFPMRRHFFERLAKRQEPFALFITCADSRVVPSLITHTNPGEIFVERNPGALVPVAGEGLAGESASIEYAIEVLHVSDIIVCAHSDCGAIKGILHPENTLSVPAVRAWLQFGHDAAADLPRNGSDQERLEELTRRVATLQLENLKSHASVRKALASNCLNLHAWIYQIDRGEVLARNERTRAFEPWPPAGASLPPST
jgi:carbonic anhydrase